ncbi:MAG TPA: sialidase family protein [Bryobacteraceae bacterium]|nr:sialidase family protein [Bryobacteraceae bacterium]
MTWIFASMLLVNVGPVSNGVPNRQPQLASGYGMVGLTFAAGQSIYFAGSNDEGWTFSPAVKVTEAKLLAAGRHRGPRVVILKDAIVISAVVGQETGDAHSHGLPADGDLISWRSVDRGKTWSRAGTVNDEPRAAREGLHAMTADSRGNLFAVWLDLRSKGTKLYGSRSTDGGMTWAKNVLVYASPDGTICECCDPSIAIDEAGRISVLWRNAVGGSRDMYVSSSRDGVQFGAPQKAGNGTWKLNACPMDGGGIAVDHGQVVSAWRREGEVFLAPAGKPETKIGAGKDVAIAAGRKGAYVAWSNGPAIEIQVPGTSAPAPLASNGSYVNLAALPDGSVLAAWEANGVIETRKVE